MQAAEDDSHTNKLLRSMETNLEELKTQLSYFLKNGTDVSSIISILRLKVTMMLLN